MTLLSTVSNESINENLKKRYVVLSALLLKREARRLTEFFTNFADSKTPKSTYALTSFAYVLLPLG